MDPAVGSVGNALVCEDVLVGGVEQQLLPPVAMPPVEGSGELYFAVGRDWCAGVTPGIILLLLAAALSAVLSMSLAQIWHLYCYCHSCNKVLGLAWHIRQLHKCCRSKCSETQALLY